jgi:hypothetical protein
MKSGAWLGVVFCCLVRTAFPQQVSPADQKVLEVARSRYYDLQARGLVSFRCGVQFDLGTVPRALLADSAVQDRDLLGQTRFTVVVGRSRPQVEHIYPKKSSAIAQQSIAPVVNWMTAIVSGFFLTWPSKGLSSPIPPFSKWVDKIDPTPEGYSIRARSTDGLESIEMSKDFVVSRIVSVGGKIDEHPVYLPTPDGLIFSGNTAIDDSEPDGRTVVRYEIESALVDGFRLPSKVHLRVNDNVDVRFSLNTCSVEKGMVLKVAPPD